MEFYSSRPPFRLFPPLPFSSLSRPAPARTRPRYQGKRQTKRQGKRQAKRQGKSQGKIPIKHRESIGANAITDQQRKQRVSSGVSSKVSTSKRFGKGKISINATLGKQQNARQRKLGKHQKTRQSKRKHQDRHRGASAKI